MNALKGDMKTTEHMGYLFLQLTPKQIISVIDFYENLAMIKIDKTPRGAYRICFGSSRQYTFPFKDYVNNGGHAFDYLGI